MGDRDRAQAEVLIWALCDLRDKMLSQMDRLEKHGSRREAAALRRDVNEAQALISRLRRRYLGGEPVLQNLPVSALRSSRNSSTRDDSTARHRARGSTSAQRR
jgi:hypothetical protein